jgi:hypothetical protein
MLWRNDMNSAVGNLHKVSKVSALVYLLHKVPVEGGTFENEYLRSFQQL